MIVLSCALSGCGAEGVGAIIKGALYPFMPIVIIAGGIAAPNCLTREAAHIIWGWFFHCRSLGCIITDDDAFLQYRAKNGDPQGKPGVYFCCHPKDFRSCFRPITDQLLELRPDIAVGYREPPSWEDEEAAAEEPVGLSRMQLLAPLKKVRY